MLDRDGFRPNVGIILLNQKNQVFWGKRIRTHSWQFPQGGIDRVPAPMHISKVALADPKSGKPTRVRFDTRDGKKVRVAVKSGELING